MEKDHRGIYQLEIPDCASDYGNETFISVSRIEYIPESTEIVVTIQDADVDDGFYQRTFEAELQGDKVVVENTERNRNRAYLTVLDVILASEDVREK